MTSSPYEFQLDQNTANYEPLSPLGFLERTAAVHPNRISCIHGDTRYTWKETRDRARRLASALKKRGIKKNDTVSVMLPNTPPMLECHFGVPMTGAVLNSLNTRLDADNIGFILTHAETKLLITDREYAPIIAKALHFVDHKITVIDVSDVLGEDNGQVGECEYEDLLAEGDVDDTFPPVTDEWDAIALNYTSGTTGNPKGVVYHHRGAYLNSLGNVVTWGLQSTNPPVYLWTLPMFHCNGWCFPWTITALAGTHVCLRKVTAEHMFASLEQDKVTHMCGAPIVMSMLINASDQERRDLPHTVEFMTAAAPPPARVLERIEGMGFRITHVYGLTEVYGPAVVCDWKEEWEKLPPAEKAAMKARQGVNYAVLQGLAVKDPKTLEDVTPDGETMGEVFMRGNIVMKGYLKNPTATEEAFEGGWFHTGDLGVMHPDGYIELKDRSKDIIISGGENISTIEIENVLYHHPDVLDAAVVARPDEKWGETPCAFVTLNEGAQVSEADIIAFCRDNLAHFKCPRTVVFGPLPKTSTGKIQKFVLRSKAKDLNEAG